nr:hypothetical protein [Tanacetum cinerariifolium]
MSETYKSSLTAIAPVLPTEEPNNYLSMGDEHLSTIPETKSDEVIKSSIENLVPILSESEDFSDIEILDLEIHSLMIRFQSLSMKFKAFLIHLHNPISIYTCVRFVKAILTMVMNVSNESRLSMGQNRAIEITFDLPTVEPKDSLRMGDEHLDTIPETKSDEFIKSSVEKLVPSPSESKDLSDSECDVPACDDFTTFSNLLFDADDDFSSSDNESFSYEDISKEIHSNPLFDEEINSMKIDLRHFNAESDLIKYLLNHDSSIITSSSNINYLLDKFVGELTLLKTIPPGIDETDCDVDEEIRLMEKFLYDNSSPRPPEEFISENSDAAIEFFSPSFIPVEDIDSFMEEINLSSDDSMMPIIKNDDYDSEVDMLILEELISNDSLSLPENESFYFDISSSPRPPTKPPDDDEIEPNLGILTVKVVGDISKHNVPMPRLFPTQPTLVSNQKKSPRLISHRGLKAFQLPSESLMMIYAGNTPILDVPFLHFYPP